MYEMSAILSCIYVRVYILIMRWTRGHYVYIAPYSIMVVERLYVIICSATLGGQRGAEYIRDVVLHIIRFRKIGKPTSITELLSAAASSARTRPAGKVQSQEFVSQIGEA